MPPDLCTVQHVDDGLVYYKQVVSELCVECQIFDAWFVHLQNQNGDDGERAALMAGKRRRVCVCVVVVCFSRLLVFARCCTGLGFLRHMIKS